MAERRRWGRRRLDNRFIDDPNATAIRQAIEEINLTQQKVAKLAGVSQATVSRAEGGRAGEKTMGTILRVLKKC